MRLIKTKLFLVFSLCFLLLKVNSQSYNMANQTVTDCNASFFDSDNTPTGNYGHSENLLFSICPNGADSIIMSFTSFCTEQNLDVLYFFDGPNLASPMIGSPQSGNTSLPPDVIATSGCLTILFESDASVNCTGWEASWQTIINTPSNPIFDPIPAQACNTTSVTLTLDQDIVCSSLNTSNMSIFGPSNQSITNITPVNCVNNVTNSIVVDFAPGTNQNGNYQVQLDADFTDDCNNMWSLTSFGNFTVDGCPISAEILANDTICLGECTDLTAIASDGDGNYNYAWNNGLASNAGPHNVCPITTTTYQVTVTDGTSAPAGTASKTVYVIQPVTMPANFTVCQTDPVIDLDATPNVGYWSGPCFGNDTLQGIFHPFWCGTGVKTVTFNHYGCENTMDITINPMNFWTSNYLLCPGSSAFNFSNNNSGGTFSGTGITDAVAGTFDPVVAGTGTHTITYSNPPCTDRTRNITVGTPVIQNDDTICSNYGIYEPSFNPKGGAWSYPANPAAITNWYWCRFNPTTAGAGTHSLLYTYGDCVDTLKITVSDVEAGNDLLRCVSNPPFNITGASPPGGLWSGVGITDAINGTFDPGTNGGNNFTSWIYYSINGCTDSLRMFVRKTDIPVNPLPSFCEYDADFTLNNTNTGRTPWSGTWSGNGVTNTSSNGTFSPSIAGTGTHTLYYEVNGCPDSTLITVFGNPNLNDTSVCILQSIFDIPTSIPGGFWSGNGIVNPTSGSFLPSTAGAGIHTIEYITPDNCYYYVNISVTAMPVVSVSGLPNSWCLADTNFVINAMPANGNWVGTTNDSVFNPFDAGTGNFNISYEIGTGECLVSASASIAIDDTLKITPYFTDTIICIDDYIKIGATGSGGNELNYSFSWNHGLGNSFENIVQADTNTVYSISLEDGCSQAATANLEVNLQQDFNLSFETSNIQCFDTDGFAKVNVTPNSNYAYKWNDDPITTTNTINALAGYAYKVIVTDNNNCEKEEYIEIPAYSQLLADFSVSPNDECVNLLEPEVYLINQSIGGTSGNWSFGDGKSLNYDVNQGNISHFYEDTGSFEIFLSLSNEGNCTDSKLQTVCVIPKSLVVSPTAFSPNGDGMNDEFKFKSFGAGRIVFTIYNRWGEKLFETNDINKGWDGTYKGKKMPIGNYTWQVEFHSLENNNTQIEKGSFQLIK